MVKRKKKVKKVVYAISFKIGRKERKKIES